MKMGTNKEFEEHLEYFIQDWHWDKKSHEFARKMALFMFGFFEYLKSQKLSESTRRKHESNCQLIGKFVAEKLIFAVYRGQPSLHETCVFSDISQTHSNLRYENRIAFRRYQQKPIAKTAWSE